MLNRSINQKKFTGRRLVLLNANTSFKTFNTSAKKSSVRMAHFNDFVNKPETSEQAFDDADGLFFDDLKVAIMNDNKDEEKRLLRTSATKREILFTEPERYVYKSQSNAYLQGYRDAVEFMFNKISENEAISIISGGLSASALKFKDDNISTWGIKALLAANSKLSGKGIRVAVLDTGVNKNHPDLVGRVVKTKKFVSGSAGDGDGHGSHCIGISCGNKNKKGQRYGIAFEAEIYAGKVLDDNGEGEDRGIIAGIEWAVKNKCKVISMSLGAEVLEGESFSETYETIAKRVMKAGSLIVAAAGNGSDRPGKIAFVEHPANCPSIMAVAAIDARLRVAGFSCGGLDKKEGGQIDIAAPGVDVFSIYKAPELYEFSDGTSMATPYVAGIVALYCQQNPQASPMEIWAMLTQNAKRLSLSSRDVGAGLVQVPPQNL
jgi:subtilisin family serine protease